MLNGDPMPKVITFDCYGTLVQWHHAVKAAARVILSRRFQAGSEEHQVEVLASRLRELAMARQSREPYVSYKEVLRLSLRSALAEAGYAIGVDDEETLLSFIWAVEPHPEVAAALESLRMHYAIAIISNSDDDLIAGSVAAIGIPFDFVVTAQQAQAYKPDHQLFLHAYAVMGVAKDETIHVGMGQFTDLKVCRELNIRSVWIDRMGEDLNAEWAADAALPDLARLPELLLSLR